MKNNETQVSTYGTRLRARTDPKHPCNRSFGHKPPNLPEEIRDRLAEKEFQQKLTGGFRRTIQVREGNKIVRKSNRCDRCFQYRSNNNTCGCTE